jgi:hypothetical protein
MATTHPCETGRLLLKTGRYPCMSGRSLQILERSIHSYLPVRSSNFSYRCDPSTLTPSLPLGSPYPFSLQSEIPLSQPGVHYTYSTRLKLKDTGSVPVASGAIDNPVSETDARMPSSRETEQGWLHPAQPSAIPSSLGPRGPHSDGWPCVDFQRITRECTVKKEHKIVCEN